ncbi:MAG: AraC family transcriptional regulator [Propionivibrio sp.]
MKPKLENILHAEATSFSCIGYSAPSFDCPYHLHPELEVLHIEGSHGRFIIGDRTGDFRPGDFYLLGSGLPHYFVNDSTEIRTPTLARSRVIQFLPDCLGSDFFNSPEMSSARELLERSSRGLVFGEKTRRRAVLILNSVFRANGPRKLARFLDLLDQLASATDVEPLAGILFETAATHRDSVRLSRVLDYIHEHIARPLRVDEVARVALLSPSAFSRLFHQHMGKPFIQHVNEVRVAKARRELIETDLSVSEICHRSGFTNLSNFNRQFLCYTGQSPTSFRRTASGIRNGQIKGARVAQS